MPFLHGSAFASELDLDHIQSVLSRVARWGLTGSRSLPTMTELAARFDQVLFKSATFNPLHLLEQFLLSLSPILITVAGALTLSFYQNPPPSVHIISCIECCIKIITKLNNFE